MSRPSKRDVPYIDPRVDHVGVERLNEVNPAKLKRLRTTWVVREGDTPLAVLLPYRTFLRIQSTIEELEASLEEFTDDFDPFLDDDLNLPLAVERFDDPSSHSATGPQIVAKAPSHEKEQG